ncbi:hypothetical protein FBUS_03021 [Fasciolopsis buskii]|uniref:G-protein coupled receptors family 1 profile domain-containing protein n=1 Tax=Fasciolopsis buskii TaxID=27845 RepID=A0A8E0S014_9TREM|nr:hypothetical protein FBUS_03021 [Fasciolopsis buski]
MTDNVTVQDLLAAEEAARSLVIQRYQPTLIAVTLLLVFLSAFGFVGNSLVIYTIGRRELPGIFGYFAKCCITVFCCCRYCCSPKGCPRRPSGQTRQLIQPAISKVNCSYSSWLSRSVRGRNWLRNRSEDASRRTTFQDNRGDTSMTNISVEENRRKSSKILHRPTPNRFYSMRQHNSNYLIFLLAFNDFIICTLDIPATIFFVIWEQGTLDVVCRLHVLLKALMLSVSILLLLLIAVDRWLIVCFVPNIRIPRSTLFLLVLMCYISGLGWAVPMGLHHGVPSRFEFSADDQLIKLGPSQLGNFTESVRTTFLHGARLTRTNHIPPKYLASLHDDNLLKTLTNYGTCQVDDRFISRSSYRNYQMAVLIFFGLVFTLICFIYGFIFTFVWWHQHRWHTRYNQSMRKEKRETPRSAPRLSNIRETESAPYQTYPVIECEKSCNSYILSENIFDCVKQGEPVRKLTQFAVRLQRSSSDTSHKERTNLHSQDEEQTEVTCQQKSHHHTVTVAHSVETAPNFSASRQCANSPSTSRYGAHKSCWSERKYKLRDSVRNRPVARRQVKSANRHLRTAVMFILVTVTFLVSYLPSLLISNGLIWKVDWETTNGIETGYFSYYGEASPIFPSAVQIAGLSFFNNCSQIGFTNRSSSRCTFLPRKPNESERSELTHHFRRLLFFLYFVNTVTNPIIYFFLNLKFRGELRQLLHRNSVRQQDGA